MRGRPATLRQCHEVYRLGSIDGQARAARYAIEEAFVGAHLDCDCGAPKFRHVVVDFSHLRAWARFAAWYREHAVHVEIGGNRVTWGDGGKLSVSHRDATLTLTIWIAPEGDFHDNVRVKRHLWLELESSEALSTDEWHRRFLYPFRHFLTLGTMRANTLSLFSVVPENSEHGIPIRVYNYFVGRDATKPAWLTPSDLLLHLGDIESDFAPALRRWFAFYERFHFICDNFFGLAYHPPTYVDQRFVTVVQACESYHREVVNTGGNASLKVRLTALLDRTNDVIAPIVTDPAAFLTDVVRTRNALVHPATKTADKVPNPNAIGLLYRRLSLMLQRCLLHELGLGSEQCQKLFWRTRQYTWLRAEAANGAD